MSTHIDAGQPAHLPLTGERTVPAVPRENYWFRRHEVVYRELLGRCHGAVVLEAGCGEGYGAALLADVADRVLALELDRAVARHVGARYPGPAVAVANLVDLPVADGAVDVVVSLQVLEHLWDQERFLAECHRVLCPGGTLLASTPNRLTFSPGRDAPLNPFHTRELDPDELADLLTGAGFVDVTLSGLHHGPRLRALDARHGGSLVRAQLAAALDPTGWTPHLLADVAAVRDTDFTVETAGLAASLDLIAVGHR